MTDAERNEKKLFEKLNRFIEIYGKKLNKMFSAIDKDIARLFSRYAKDNSMTILEAYKYLTDNEREEFLEDLNFYLEKIQDEEYLKEHYATLTALGIRARISRLDFVKADILMNVDTFFKELKEESKKLLGEVGSEAFIQKVEEIAKEMPKGVENTVEIVVNNTKKTPLEEAVEIGGETHNIKVENPQLPTSGSGGATITVDGKKIDLSGDNLSNWGTTNPDLMDEVLEFPWSGSNYSEKIWGECENFEKVLKDKMVLGFVEGKPYDQIVKEMEKELGVERWKIERLVRTEGAFISNQAQLSAYYKSGIEKYQYLARVDQRTSEICKELNGKVFEVQKAQAGENFPPMHPYCRSVTKAYFGSKSNETEEKRLGKENTENKGDTDNKGDKLIKGDTELKGLDKSLKKGYNNYEGMKFSAKNSIKQTGARTKVEPFNPNDPLEIEAAKKYEQIIADKEDIDCIAKNTGFSKREIKRIKNHVFRHKHLMEDDEGNLVSKFFDADEEIADAWFRLKDGSFTDKDIALLKHELAESKFEKPGQDYHIAHVKANEVSDWEHFDDNGGNNAW